MIFGITIAAMVGVLLLGGLIVNGLNVTKHHRATRVNSELADAVLKMTESKQAKKMELGL